MYMYIIHAIIVELCCTCTCTLYMHSPTHYCSSYDTRLLHVLKGIFIICQSKDVRIIFGYFYEDKAVVVMCYAKHMGLTDDKYLWVLPGWYTDNWFEVADTMSWADYMYSCTSQEIKEAIDYSMTVDFNTYPLEDDNDVSLSGYVSQHVIMIFIMYMYM